VSELIIYADALIQEELTAVNGTKEIALAVPAVVALVAHDDVPISNPIRDPVNEALIPVTFI
jgi:hypothetical protein